MITLIAAIARNGAIGRDNALLWHLPDDMRRFRRLTTGHTIIMGSRTFRSFPHGALPQRRNMVLSHDTTLTLPGAEVYHTLAEALQAAHADDPHEEVFVIGGACVYSQALPLAHRLCLTVVDDTPTDADAYFPYLLPHEWHVTATETHAPDERHDVGFVFVDAQRCHIACRVGDQHAESVAQHIEKNL